MISFKQFITEEQEFDFDKFLADCKPFFEEIKGIDWRYLPYHGTKNVPDDWRILKHKVRAEPRDTNRFIHDFVNDYLEKKFKWRAREDGIFVTGRYAVAAIYYGVATHIIPVGKYQYIWSPQIEDFTSWVQSFTDRSMLKNELIELITSKLNKLDFKTDDIKNALTTENEIIIKADSYYQFMWGPNFTFEKEVLPKLIKLGIVK